MRFGVVACSACRRVQAVELHFGQVRCRACRASIPLAEQKVLYGSDDEAAVAHQAARLSAQLAKRDDVGPAEALAAVEADRRGSIPELLQALSARKKPFDQSDFERTMTELKVPGDPARLLATLVRDSLVFEPRAGRFLLLA